MNVRVIERDSSSRTVLYVSIVNVTIYGHLVVTTDKDGELKYFPLDAVRSIDVDEDGAAP